MTPETFILITAAGAVGGAVLFVVLNLYMNTTDFLRRAVWKDHVTRWGKAKTTASVVRERTDRWELPLVAGRGAAVFGALAAVVTLPLEGACRVFLAA